MQLVLRVAGIIAVLVSIIWWFAEPSFATLYTFITGLVAFLSSFAIPKQETKGESLDQRNRRVMLDHVENFWVKGVLEKSLHGAALLELGIKEDPIAVSYPWTIKKESTNETLPAGKSMLEIFQEIGVGRSLLILGAPGSGKTTMLLELTRELIERARQDEVEPIPVVFNLASWKEKQTLADWLAGQLNIVYYVPRKIAPSWVDGNKMLLLLDGLDEVKQDSRAKCVEAINQFRNEHGLTSLVVCSRIEEYAAINTKLLFEGAITLQPLTSQQVNAYFERLGKSLASVKQLLKKDKTLQELAETPLMLSIMAIAYKDMKADELFESNRIEDQRKHLFTIYIDRMFERSARSANALFTKPQTLHYLSWLAATMIRHNLITCQIESMQPSWLEEQPQNRLYRLYVGLSDSLLVGLSGGLIAMLFGGLSTGLFAGLLFGLVGGLTGGMTVGLGGGWSLVPINRIIMRDRLKWSWKTNPRPLIGWLLTGLSFGFGVELITGLLAGLIAGLSSGLLIGLLLGLTSEQVEEMTYPGQRLKQTFLNGLFITLINWLGVGVFFGLIVGFWGGLMFGLTFGTSAGLLVGLITGYLPLVQHYSLRLVLVQFGLLPWRLITLLQYAVDLIFLRRVGGSYIFVHRLLMEHFAEMEVQPSIPPT